MVILMRKLTRLAVICFAGQGHSRRATRTFCRPLAISIVSLFFLACAAPLVRAQCMVDNGSPRRTTLHDNVERGENKTVRPSCMAGIVPGVTLKIGSGATQER